MKKIIVLSLLYLLSCCAYGQLSSHELNGDQRARIFLKAAIAYNEVKYPDALGAGVITFDLDLTKSNFEFRGYNTSHRFPSLGDFWIPAFGELIGFTFRGKDTPAVNGNLGSTTLSSLIFGWHNHAWSVLSTDFINLAAGFHWGDYGYGFQRYEEPNRFFTANALTFADDYTDPSGYYAGFGPSWMADVALLPDLLFHYEGAFVFTARLLKEGSSVAPKNSPNPKFLNQQFEVRYNRLFIGAEYCAALKNNEAAHAGRRLAIISGFTF